jgi:biopolymer transport protein TolR
MGMAVPSGGKGKGGATPTINITPLVDVVLVLLIIFMVVTPLLSKTVWMQLPKKPDENVEPPPPDALDQPVVLSVDADEAGTLRINQTVITPEELKARLPRMLAARPDHTLYFQAADKARYERAVRALDLARSSGADNIAILTQKPSP